MVQLGCVDTPLSGYVHAVVHKSTSHTLAHAHTHTYNTRTYARTCTHTHTHTLTHMYA